MIIVDLNQVMIANMMAQLGAHKNAPLSEDMLRHMVLNGIRSYKTKFSAKYGEMVIAADARHSWRKDVFPYYKANRGTDRDASEIDWDFVFGCFNKLREELREFFPYRVIWADGLEADDVIAVLARENAPQAFGDIVTGDRVLILSGDKDFKQLQKYAGVDQYCPTQKKWLTTDDPAKFLQEHIIRGDKGDGVPNILSSDDSIVKKIRQKSIMEKKVDVWLKSPGDSFCENEEMRRNYHRNRVLIDLDCTPDHLAQEVIRQFREQEGKDRRKLQSYFIHHNLKHLFQYIGDF